MRSYMADRKNQRAERKQRQEEYGHRYAKSPEEQAALNPENQYVQDVVLAKASQGEKMGLEGGGLGEGGFDPSDPASVLAMQKLLNRGGFTDEEGMALAEDGRMGPKTLSALRAMQGGHRGAGASIAELQGREEGIGRLTASDRSAEQIYSPEGRGKTRVGSSEEHPNQFAAPFIERTIPAEQEITSKERQDAVGTARGYAKSVDDTIEEYLPWIGGSDAYRGAKEKIKQGFNWAGNADY